MKLETNRLSIRYFLETDADDIYHYLSKEEVVKYEPYSVYTYEKAIETAKARQDDKRFYAVALKSGKVIGNIYFSKGSYDTWELGYVFNSEFWSNGYAYESIEALITYAINNWDTRRVTAFCNPENTSSWKLLENLSFRREGHLKKNIYFNKDKQNNPIWQDTYEYAILQDEWLNK